MTENTPKLFCHACNQEILPPDPALNLGDDFYHLACAPNGPGKKTSNLADLETRVSALEKKIENLYD